MLDAALVGVECLNVRCVSARAPVLHYFAVVELPHVAQWRTGKVLAPPAVKRENTATAADGDLEQKPPPLQLLIHVGCGGCQHTRVHSTLSHSLPLHPLAEVAEAKNFDLRVFIKE